MRLIDGATYCVFQCLATASADGTICLWDLRDMSCLQVLLHAGIGLSNSVVCVAVGVCVVRKIRCVVATAFLCNSHSVLLFLLTVMKTM